MRTIGPKTIISAGLAVAVGVASVAFAVAGQHEQQSVATHRPATGTAGAPTAAAAPTTAPSATPPPAGASAGPPVDRRAATTPAAGSGSGSGPTRSGPTRSGPDLLSGLPPEVRQVLAESTGVSLDEVGVSIPPEPPVTAAVVPQPGLGLADPSVQQVFDIDLFEQNIREALDGETVGYSYSIGRSGQVYAEDGVGAARTGQDSPAAELAEDKPMTVASISKTITAVAMLRLLEQQGISVDDPIGPWLPEAWERGEGVDGITFRELMTHTSGMRQNYERVTGKGGKVTGAYDNIRIAVGEDLGSTTYRYANMNFSIFRLILPKLLGYDFSEAYDDPPEGYQAEFFDLVTGAIFHVHLEQMLGSIGVTGGCVPWDQDPQTVLYRFPYDDKPGWQTGSALLGCGGYGMYVSASGLASFLSHLRYTDELLSPQARQLMTEGKLGLRATVGAHGSYLGHGGDWSKNGRGMSGCVLSFPIHVDVALLANSRGGDYPHTCTVLQQAFDAAWVAQH